MTSMDVFLTGVPAGAIGVSDGFESPSTSARTMVLCLIARRLDDDDDDDDDVETDWRSSRAAMKQTAKGR